MQFALTVNMDGAAFDDADAELERILAGLSRVAACTMTMRGEGTVLDVNGNTVGRWTITGERDQ